MLKDAKNYLKGYKQTTESAFFRNVHERTNGESVL